MAKYWDLEGQEISCEEWGEIFHSKERFLARDALDKTPWGFGVEVSSIWIGMSWLLEDLEGEKPLIFETMIFPLDRESRWSELGCWRWESREAAVEGHRKIVDGIMSGELELRLPEFSDDELF